MDNKILYKATQTGVYVFSEPKKIQYISKYLDKISWVVIFCLFFYSIAIESNFNINGIYIYIFLVFLNCLFIAVNYKFAEYIELDFNNGVFFIRMRRGGQTIHDKFSEIEKISINGYVIIKINGRKIFYFDTQNVLLLKCLNKISEINWGVLCVLYGPSQKIRNEIAEGQRDVV